MKALPPRQSCRTFVQPIGERANVAGPNQSTTPDNAFTADDIIVFLGRYFAGC